MGKEQVLRIEPAEFLKFKGPFTDVVISELHVSNPTSQKVAFKVKTTAPKRYCVKPNSAVLDGGARVTVQVMLQPAEFDPNEKPKHKFMIQSLVVPDGTPAVADLETLWKNHATPDSLMDTKLRCVFENTGAQSQQQQSHPAAAMQSCESASAPTDKISYTTTPDATPRPSTKGSFTNVEEQYAKVLSENKSLRSELGELQKELTNRKEENVRLRKVAVSDTVPTTPSAAVTTAPLPKKTSKGVLLLATLVLFLSGIGLGVTTVKYGVL